MEVRQEWPNMENMKNIHGHERSDWRSIDDTMVRRWMQQTSFLQICGYLMPGHLIPIKLMFLYFLDTFCTRNVIYALDNTINEKEKSSQVEQ